MANKKVKTDEKPNFEVKEIKEPEITPEDQSIIELLSQYFDFENANYVRYFVWSSINAIEVGETYEGMKIPVWKVTFWQNPTSWKPTRFLKKHAQNITDKDHLDALKNYVETKKK